MQFEQSSEVPVITLENLTLSRKNTRSMCRRSYYSCLADRKWLISGLDVNILNSDLEYVHFFVQHQKSKITRCPKILIENSSFGGIKLKSGTAVNINDCHLSGRSMKTPLIEAEGASVTITCSEFDHFKSIDGPSILHGKHGTEVSIENSSFHSNRALIGIVYLHDNCSIYMSSVQVYLFNSHKYGLSAFIFWKSVTCLIEDSEFTDNKGFFGSAIAAIDNTVIKSINCFILAFGR